MIGTTISHYRITGKLGEGGMGVVYRAEDTRLQRTVALKVLPGDSVTAADRERFLREAQSAAQVHHPNICPIYEVDEENGRLFFVMALVEGPSLRSLLKQGPIPVERAIEIAAQVASGLDAAHSQGVIHRDIKSANVVEGLYGQPCILDFGLALRADASRLTRTGGFVGTPAYMSPEQAEGGAVDHRTDLWSLGVVLYELLTGELPFRRDTELTTLYAIVHETPKPPSALRPGLPAALDELVLKCLAKAPGQRFQSAAELGERLRQIQAGLSSAHPTVTLDRTRPVLAAPPNRARIWLALAVVLAIAAGAHWRLRQPGADLPEQKEVVVLPLSVIGPEEPLRAVTDGLTETITAKLSQLEQFQGKLTVVPASEVRARKITSAEAARKAYGANLVISGSAQQTGARVQCILNLINAQTLRQVASRTITLDSGNLLALRDGAVTSVVDLLELRLSADANGAVKAGETGAPAAYAQYLRGRGYLARYDLQGNVDRALASLQDAVKQDPNYALAHAALAEAYWWKAKMTNDRHWADRALESGEKAVQLNPTLVVARVKLGEIYSDSGRVDDAIREHLKALEISPGNAEAYRMLGLDYSAAGRYSEAEAAFQEAVKRRPTDWEGRMLLGIFYYQRGRYAEAKSAYLSALKLTPDNELLIRNLAGVHMRLGQYAEASSLIQKTLATGSSTRGYNMLGIAYYYQRRFSEAASALESSLDIDNSIYTTWGNLGTVYRWVPGSESKAQAAFQRAIELAEKAQRITPADNNIHANLAEYHAKLGDQKKALAEIQAIPETARRPYMARIALAYEMLGDRKHAIDTVRTQAVDASALSDLRNDPDLAKLWKDPEFQSAIRASQSTAAH
ncbi:serine/threonine-protein kinase [Paludibaculum fermentans]|uniref:non-specific serine/threonine protein kinase n=1 Tax=Paludibaculum fermentans TaxID=1473598 RepID=A0A7S7SLE6_PALFE|nr:serine/threonine-protein kinase [Paludibaculum fermentans]QOY89289.1 protein kinase [Paludibaculum fermentans]